MSLKEVCKNYYVSLYFAEYDVVTMTKVGDLYRSHSNLKLSSNATNLQHRGKCDHLHSDEIMVIH